jgi:hypothetical protein
MKTTGTGPTVARTTVADTSVADASVADASVADARVAERSRRLSGTGHPRFKPATERSLP